MGAPGWRIESTLMFSLHIKVEIYWRCLERRTKTLPPPGVKSDLQMPLWYSGELWANSTKEGYRERVWKSQP